MFFLLLGALIASYLRYRNIVKEKAGIESQLSETRIQVGFLDGRLKQEKELAKNLEEERSLLANNLKEAESKISQLDIKYVQAQEHIFSLTKELRDLEGENSRAKEEKVRWEEKLSALEERDARLDKRMHSIPELKKAIKELKIEMRKSRLKFASTVRPLKRLEIIEGNSGFMVKEGLSTYRPRLKIKVEPAQ